MCILRRELANSLLVAAMVFDFVLHVDEDVTMYETFVAEIVFLE